MYHRPMLLLLLLLQPHFRYDNYKKNRTEALFDSCLPRHAI